LFDPAKNPDLLVGMGAADDAAVYRINRRTAIVATLDFFAPVVDDPFTDGAIAAANAMSDVFAMGGEVILALNVAAFPEDLPAEVVQQILTGGASKVAEAGGVIAGGHTVWDQEPKYGLSVLGRVSPARVFRKGGLRPGDVLYLTKPLGSGTLASAAKNGRAEANAWERAQEWMLRLNRHASHLLQRHRVRAATDVTGFGLAGHLWEMVSQAGVRAVLEAAALPAMEGAIETLGSGIVTGGGGRNRAWTGENVKTRPGVAEELVHLAHDPQTSGGLLFGVPRRKSEELELSFAADDAPLWRIGVIERGAPGIAIV
jgi:selenide,water dikinase